MSVDKFFAKSKEILDLKAGSVGDGAYKLVRASELAVWSQPGTSPHITEARVCRMPTNTPAGIAAWESQSLAFHQELAASEAKQHPAKPATTKRPTNLTLKIST
jgi:hypothetical protein